MPLTAQSDSQTNEMHEAVLKFNITAEEFDMKSL